MKKLFLIFITCLLIAPSAFAETGEVSDDAALNDGCGAHINNSDTPEEAIYDDAILREARRLEAEQANR